MALYAMPSGDKPAPQGAVAHHTRTAAETAATPTAPIDHRRSTSARGVEADRDGRAARSSIDGEASTTEARVGVVASELSHRAPTARTLRTRSEANDDAGAALAGLSVPLVLSGARSHPADAGARSRGG